MLSRNENIIVFNDDIREELRNLNSSEIDEFLKPIVKKIRALYKNNGDPMDILEISTRISKEFNDIPKKEYSFEFAKIKSIESQMLLAIGKNEELLLQAFEAINQAIEICLRLDTISEQTNEELIKNVLILAVILKALGKFDSSIKTIQENAKILLQQRGVSKIELIILKRQEVMMNQTIEGHKNLLEEAIHYKNLKPVEYYSTLKRVLEFSMNREMYTLAGKLIPELKSSFNKIKSELPPISHVSFIKNLGQYYLNSGEIEFGKRLLEISLAHAEKLNLNGQKYQINSILEEFDSGKKTKLKTFKI